jgi:hypothetical protein
MTLLWELSAEQSNKSTYGLSVENEGCASRASSRRVGGLTYSGLVAVGTLITRMSLKFGTEGCRQAKLKREEVL